MDAGTQKLQKRLNIIIIILIFFIAVAVIVILVQSGAFKKKTARQWQFKIGTHFVIDIKDGDKYSSDVFKHHYITKKSGLKINSSYENYLWSLFTMELHFETEKPDIKGQLDDTREILSQSISADVVEKIMTLVTPVDGYIEDFDVRVFQDGDYYISVEKGDSIYYIDVTLNTDVWNLKDNL